MWPEGNLTMHKAGHDGRGSRSRTTGAKGSGSRPENRSARPPRHPMILPRQNKPHTSPNPNDMGPLLKPANPFTDGISQEYYNTPMSPTPLKPKPNFDFINDDYKPMSPSHQVFPRIPRPDGMSEEDIQRIREQAREDKKKKGKTRGKR